MPAATHRDEKATRTPPGATALPISEVARRTGLPTTTLRIWHRRYGLGASETSPGGHRRYDPVDLTRIQAAQQLVHQGVPTAEAARTVLLPAAHGLVLPPHADPAAHHLAAAALELDGPRCRRLLRDHLAGNGVDHTWQHLLRPVLAAIGDRWSDLPHGIAVEHLLSHVATAALGGATQGVDDPPARTARSVLLACVPDEEHDLPLVALAAALSHRGVGATLLGAGTPTGSLADAVRRTLPAVVVVLALLRDLADASLFEAVRGGGLLLAAGPGWADVALPADVRRVDDLPGAVALVVAASAGR